jgi:tRNA A-37 threonylcarbamoyl transferase component Bud32/tetratricopeptide (TPR) repeat protein/TolB-like protein
MPETLQRLQAALAERYAIERELDRGGMARVYLADDLKHRRKVAIKVLHPELAFSLSADRFLREIEIAAGLQHPHILPLYDSGEADGLLYYVMPYVEDGSLRALMERKGQVPLPEAVRITREAAQALEVAHRKGVVHRDIKPENILMSGGQAVVADFGIARALSAAGDQRTTQTGFSLGTPAYMSVEQAAGEKELDGRSDLYSLGCVLYELLTGAAPLTGDTPQQTLWRRMSERPQLPSEVRERVPAELSAMTEKLLAGEPADRYATADELAEELARVERQVSHTRGFPAPARMRFPSLRSRLKRRLAIGGAAAALLIAGAAIVGKMLLQRTPAAALDPERVAVLPFENLTGDPTLEYIGRATAEQLGAAIQLEEIGQVVPAPVIQEMLEAGGDAEGVEALAARAGAGTVVSGSYYLEGDSLSFHVDVTNPEAGRLVGAVGPVRGPRQAPGEAIERTREQLLVLLAMAFDVDVGAAAAISGYPTLEAYRVFAEGKDMWLEGDYQRSIQLLREAMRLDTSFVVVPLVWLMPAYYYLMDLDAADSVLRVAERYRSRTSQYHRHVLDGYASALTGDRERQYRSVRAAAVLSPGNYWNASYAAGICIWTNRPQEALRWVGEVLPSVEGDPLREPGLLYLVAEANHQLGHYSEELVAIRRLMEFDPTESMWVGFDLRPLAALGRLDEVRTRVGDLGAMTLAADNIAFLAVILAAQELRTHGMAEPADELLQRVIDDLQDRPELAQERRFQLGLAYYLSERWQDALAVFKDLAREDMSGWRHFPEGPVPDHMDYQGFLGLSAARLGDREAALEIYDWLRDLEEPYLFGHNTAYRARIAAILDRPDEATELLAQAFSEGMFQLGSWPRYGWDMDFESFDDYRPYVELMRPKG